MPICLRKTVARCWELANPQASAIAVIDSDGLRSNSQVSGPVPTSTLLVTALSLSSQVGVRSASLPTLSKWTE